MKFQEKVKVSRGGDKNQKGWSQGELKEKDVWGAKKGGDRFSTWYGQWNQEVYTEGVRVVRSRLDM